MVWVRAVYSLMRLYCNSLTDHQHTNLFRTSDRPKQQPLLFQRRRLEQAGYRMLDRLDDFGRLDYSYLIAGHNSITQLLLNRTTISNQPDIQRDHHLALLCPSRVSSNYEIYRSCLKPGDNQLARNLLSRLTPFKFSIDLVLLHYLG